MSNDKEKLSQLSARVDELLITINKVTEELRAISASIKLLSVSQTQTQTITTTPKTTNPTKSTTLPTTNSAIDTQTTTKLRSLDDVRMSFPEELEAKLSFEDKDDYIIIKTKQYLGSDNFVKIASTVRGMNGEYISAGKDSYFRVPKKKDTN
ncbi:MAG: hypothetical protein FWH37_07585 [Candidatus Bathyarchaeota archaeon]|nr:hypothetical protein [Candidatus Termiticorpusculum sp.]